MVLLAVLFFILGIGFSAIIHKGSKNNKEPKNNKKLAIQLGIVGIGFVIFYIFVIYMLLPNM